MLPSSASYSTNGSKRRKLSPPPPLSMTRASSAPTEPHGWCTNQNTKINHHHTNTSPPFDPKPYSLDNTMCRDTASKKRNMDSLHNTNSEQPPTKRMKIAPETETAPLNIRIPKMTEKMTNNTRETITISSSSSQSASPPKKKRDVIDLLNDDNREEEILIGTVQHRQYNREFMRREKEKRRRRKKERRKSRKSHKGSSKYPRKLKINGVKWKRKYAADEKRYYWVQKGNSSKSSWNPFQDAGQIAPWLKGRSHWQQWMDQDTKKYYYFNPLNNRSTFDRPVDYQSPEEIMYDSAREDRKRMQPIYNDAHNDDEIQVIGISHGGNNKRSRTKAKHRTHKDKRHHKSHTKSSSHHAKPTSRRDQYDNPNAGGFSFFDVPTDHKEAAALPPTEMEHDLSVLQAVSGLEDILNGNIKSREKEKTEGSPTADSSGSVDVEAIFGMDGDLEKAAGYNPTVIVKAVWKVLEPKVRQEPKIKFNELISTHAKGLNLDDHVINALHTEYNQTVVDIFQSSMTNAFIKSNTNGESMDLDVNLSADNNKKTSVWADLDANLRSVYRSQNAEAIRFVLEIFDGGDKKESACAEEDHHETKAKCLSILSQNSDNLVRILKSDRKGFVEDVTRILCGMMAHYDCDEEIDVIFGAFNFAVMDEYMFALIRYGKSNQQTIEMMSKLSKLCIVYQLIGCMRISQILERFNVVHLVKQEDLDLFDVDATEDTNEMSASMLLCIEVLTLIETLTNGYEGYKAKGMITKLQGECIEEVQRGHGLRHFTLDGVYSVLSEVLKHNLSLHAPNLQLFGVCCGILKNIISENEAIHLKILGVAYKRSKRIIYLLHKTYTDLTKGEEDKNESNDDDDNEEKEASPATQIKRVIQPYEFKNFDDASFEAYGIELDVSQREDAKQLSNIDCRESIGDILLAYIQRMDVDEKKTTTMDDEKMKWKYLIGSVFYEMLRCRRLIKVSWGYNKALNHYHRDNICIDWIKSELLYQHKLEGRRKPNLNNQPQRHFRICSLIEILFNPLIWDYAQFSALLQKLCDLCSAYQEKTGREMETWKRLQTMKKNRKICTTKTDAECMSLYTSNLWNEIVPKCMMAKCDAVLVQLLYECVNEEEKKEENESNEIDVKALCLGFEKMFRNKSRRILNARSQLQRKSKKKKKSNRMNDDEMAEINDFVSLFLRSNTLHLLVGLTQMEASSTSSRNCARRAIRCIVWSVNDLKHKLLLKKSQLPFLPTIHHCYKSYAGNNNNCNDTSHIAAIHRKSDNILVVGDGNLSFGRALSRLFGESSTKKRLHAHKLQQNTNSANIDYGARNIVVTCYESAMELLARYPHSGSVVAEITDRGGFVLYGIDATSLASTLSDSFMTYGCDRRAFPLFADHTAFVSFKYDVIIWNFPHAMNRSFNPAVNSELVENFFLSAKQMLARNGEIHITLHINHQIDDEIGKKAAINKTYHQYDTWRIDLCADNQQLRCTRKHELKHRLYPGYAIKNVQGNPFNIVKAETYVFKRCNEILIE